MSLHCPATLIVAGHREEHLRVLMGSLRDRRVAAVYTSPAPEAVATGQAVAAELDAVARVASWLHRPDEGDDEDEEEGPPADRFEDGLRAVADLHRGETVLVLVPSSAAADWSVVELEIGDDGVRPAP